MTVTYDLDRFVAAQEAGDTYSRAIAELRSDRKISHWMWFVFPQLAGLGRSEASRRYAITSLAEAQAYLRHPLLGRRLVESAGTVCGSDAPSAEAIFGPLDARKLWSSMTLFMRARPDQGVFADVIDRFFRGQPDCATDELLVWMR